MVIRFFRAAKAARHASSIVPTAIPDIEVAKSQLDDFVVSAQQLTAEAQSVLPNVLQLILIAFSATTSMAVGFLMGIGLDFVALLDKWSILGAIIFYFSVVFGVLSPLLALPRTLHAWANKKNAAAIARKEELRHKNRMEELTLNEIVPSIEQALKKLAEQRERRALFEKQRTNAVTALARNKTAFQSAEGSAAKGLQKTIDRLQQEETKWTEKIAVEDSEIGKVTAELALLETRRSTLEGSGHTIKTSQWPKYLAYGLYVLVGAVFLLNVMGELPTLVIAVCVLALWAATTKDNLGIIAPWIGLLLLATGYLLSISVQSLDKNVQISILGQPDITARVLWSGPDGILVLPDACAEVKESSSPCGPRSYCADSAKVQTVLYVPKNNLTSAKLLSTESTMDWLSRTKPLCWLAGVHASSLSVR